MTSRPRDTAGMEINRAWRAEQAKLKAAQQDAMVKAHNDVVVVEPPAVIHQGTPHGPPECQNCTVKKECRQVMKLWGNRAPRPAIVKAWCGMIDRNVSSMICLSGLRESEQIATRFSMRDLK